MIFTGLFARPLSQLNLILIGALLRIENIYQNPIMCSSPSITACYIYNCLIFGIFLGRLKYMTGTSPPWLELDDNGSYSLRWCNESASEPPGSSHHWTVQRSFANKSRPKSHEQNTKTELEYQSTYLQSHSFTFRFPISGSEVLHILAKRLSSTPFSFPDICPKFFAWVIHEDDGDEEVTLTKVHINRVFHLISVTIKSQCTQHPKKTVSEDSKVTRFFAKVLSADSCSLAACALGVAKCRVAASAGAETSWANFGAAVAGVEGPSVCLPVCLLMNEARCSLIMRQLCIHIYDYSLIEW